MLYTTMNIGGTDYKARLNAKACVDLEKKLGTNPLNIFAKIADNGNIPDLGVLITMLQASLTAYNHGITMDKTYELYDKFVDDGNTLMDLVPILLDVFKVSGFFKEDTGDEEKN